MAEEKILIFEDDIEDGCSGSHARNYCHVCGNDNSYILYDADDEDWLTLNIEKDFALLTIIDGNYKKKSICLLTKEIKSLGQRFIKVAEHIEKENKQ